MAKVIWDLDLIVRKERWRSALFAIAAGAMAIAGVALLIHLGSVGLSAIDRPLPYDPTLVPAGSSNRTVTPSSPSSSPATSSSPVVSSSSIAPATQSPGTAGGTDADPIYAPSDTIVTARTLYLLVRGTGLAAIIGGIIFFVAGLARSALDQATRHEKRLIAAKVMDVVTVGADNQLDENRLHLAHEILTVWGNTVESAYTPPRSVKKIQTEVEAKAGDRSARITRKEDEGEAETS